MGPRAERSMGMWRIRGLTRRSKTPVCVSVGGWVVDYACILARVGGWVIHFVRWGRKKSNRPIGWPPA